MTKKSIRCLVSFFIMAALLLSGLPALAAPPDNFTATMVSMGMEMPMARMGAKSRVENPMMKGMVTITLADAKKTILMSTAGKTYFEQPIQDRGTTMDVYDPEMVFEKKKIGTETIDGHPCIKYDSTFYRKSKPAEKHKATIWEAQDLKDFPIQTEITMPADRKSQVPAGKMVMTYKNVKLGAATASMFEVPKDYRKAGSMQEVLMPAGTTDMSEMMKNMPKGQRPPKP